MNRTNPNSAFTMIEMLIVMSIMATLMGLGIGAWLNTAERSKSLATQQVVYSLIQQARNRSLSSGEPVVVRILKADGRIIGMHKQFLWTTKNAWRAGTLVARPPDTPSLPLFIEEEDGFSMRCQINAPPAGNSGALVIPLIHLAEKGSSDGKWVDTTGTKPIAGLELWRVPQFINHDDVAVAVAETWALIGWVGKRKAYPSGDRSKIGTWSSYIKADLFVREWSFNDDDGDASSGLIDLDAERYSLKPYTGDQWIDVELVYDNNNLYLYRNGQQTDFLEMARHLNPLTAIAGQEIDIYIANHERDVARTEYLSVADIKEVSLLQVGSGDEEFLPGSITPKYDYKIVCVDGIITCYRIDETDANRPYVNIDKLSFVDRELDSINFDIAIGPDGTLINSQLYSAEDIGTYVHVENADVIPDN